MSRNDWQADKPLILDTNTALSGLIGGATRKLIFEVDRDLRYPEPSFEEIQRNRGVIQERAGLSATAIGRSPKPASPPKLSTPVGNRL